MKKLLSGNEAIALGAYEAGVKIGVGYPGTPSTEVLQHFKNYPGVYAQWSPNEKVALEVGAGASIAGARALVTMKHVGVNVAADPLFTLSYTGINGGLVLLSADDPGMHSSQNEQDNRYYALMSKIPCLEPSDSQEAKDMVAAALEISEQFDTPVMLRTTTRVNHSQTMVETAERIEQPLKEYKKDAGKYVATPGNARARRLHLEQRMKDLRLFAETSQLNSIHWAGKEVGVITAGISYTYVREVMPRASVLKLGITNPLPEKLIEQFASQVDRVVVVEELDPFLETQIKAMGIEVLGKEIVPKIGELNPVILAKAFREAGLPVAEQYQEPPVSPLDKEAPEAPVRPPVLCAGCPHRATFHVLRKLKLTVTGDIGCYTLGSAPPLSAMDTCICMGASIGVAHGMELANPDLKGNTVAVIGDSTFLHSGVTGLMDIVYNKGKSTVLILDNRTTAMTGHQDHPATGKTLMGRPTVEVDLEALVKSLGIKRVKVLDPINIDQFEKAVKEEVAAAEPSVIIARHPCALLTKEPRRPVTVNAEACIKCKLCLKLGCPAISHLDGVAVIDGIQCNGCGLCVQVCKKGAIIKGGQNNA
ncbi:indolepyruvate ferredoxin oxidoreductase subunit alpha [Desulfofalx alkaliphila]|uniref:indolepyruvate ferredoxin oxidoreductase subunit alpha n=1 Tax=Desulfofalx alkaliphila TaxID=105483 RepID=UPI0004E1603F|nr:indolepyruvate ferredoxin oxidoreductase subunit alpha [Desulfofalx alkaliphila]